MNERVKEIVSDAARWSKEALVEWGDSIKDSPEAHAYSVILGAILAVVARWFL